MKNIYHSNNLKKHMTIFIIIYVIAFAINIIGALWYPDYNLSPLNIIASIVFTIGLGLIIIKLIYFDKTKWVSIILHIGFLSGIFNYFAYRYLGLRGIGTPLYILFISPFFGFNYLFEVRYGTFSAMVAILYVIALLSVLLLNSIKNLKQKAL
ncbi:MAG: hypothetical protein KAH05_07340 [Clostridiales bacterium]|nr:hypothetical protein [Clostridiales bacterium]